MIKRSIDLSFLIIGFTLLMPILLIVILLVVIFLFFEDGHPIFYTQDRYAKNKKKFKLFKFRSMIKNAEQQTGAIWASKEDDPRLTKTGKFIRKYRHGLYRNPLLDRPNGNYSYTRCTNL